MHLGRRSFLASLTMVGLLLTGPAAVGAPGQGQPAAAATRSAQEPIPIVLPAPTGPSPTGTTLLHLTDQRRRDTLTGSRHRRLVVQAWYPAQPGTGRGKAPYAPPGEVAELQRSFGFAPGAFETTTHSDLDALPARGRHPLVLFSHGMCGARTDSTIVAKDLASRGYVVLAIGTTGESTAVQLADGTVVTTADPEFCAAGAAPYTTGKPVLERLSKVRVADTRFVLDTVTRPGKHGKHGKHCWHDTHSKHVQHSKYGKHGKHCSSDLLARLRQVVDPRRVGMYGHSFGGGTAASVMAADRRVDAGVDLDGFVIGPAATRGLTRPFLVVGSSYHTPADDLSWRTFLPRLRGWHRWFQVEQAGHYRFIDYGGSARRWGLDTTMKQQDPETWTQIFGDIDDAESQRVNRALVGGMFDRFLRGRPAPVLDDPTARHPLVKDRTADIGRDWG